MQDRTVGFLGAGNMAGALIKGLLVSKALPPERIWASDVREERLVELGNTHGIRVTRDNPALLAACDVVVLSVKPQVVDRVMPAVASHIRPGALLISVAAGVSIAAMEARLPEGARVVRSMPNTPAIALAGATAIARGTHADDNDLRVARALFEAVGRVTVLDETLLDAVTGLSGSGPAYVMLMIEALADGGVKVGLHRETALMLAAQTVFGSAKLLLDTGMHPGALKDMVTSPGGTAIAGLHTLESGGLRRTLIDAVEAATQRSEQLGAQMAAKLAKTLLQPHLGHRHVPVGVLVPLVGERQEQHGDDALDGGLEAHVEIPRPPLASPLHLAQRLVVLSDQHDPRRQHAVALGKRGMPVAQHHHPTHPRRTLQRRVNERGFPLARRVSPV